MLSWKLCLVADPALAGGGDLTGTVEAALAGGVDCLQLRCKDAPEREFLSWALRLREVTRHHQVPLLVNDRIDLALACSADGVHLGLTDLPVPVARRLLGPEACIGGSAHSLATARQMEEAGADYLGLGPVFEARGTKPDAEVPGGLDLLRAVRAATDLPLVAIGGIQPANAATVAAAGADGIAVVSALLRSPDPLATARDLREAFTQK
jgi:thiamine-phosphate pyrophosphorylase